MYLRACTYIITLCNVDIGCYFMYDLMKYAESANVLSILVYKVITCLHWVSSSSLESPVSHDSLISPSLILCLHWANVTYWYGSVRFGTVINYSVNCCTTVPYRTVLSRFTRKHRTGAVRYGTVWYGTVRYGTVRYGMVWYGTVRYGMVWYGTVRYGTLGNGSVNTVLALAPSV